MAIKKWTEKKIAELQAAGYGQGKLSSYKPWLNATSFSSCGVTRQVWGLKTERTHHLFSDVEHRLFFALEWSLDVVDVWEQFPLDRDLTLEVARTLGVRHPYYPGTTVPTVMTVDFLIQRGPSGDVLEAFDAKRTEEAEDETSLAKLDIVRKSLAEMGITHHLVFHTHIPEQRIKNIEWIRASHLKPGEIEPEPGYWAALKPRMLASIAGCSPRQKLSDFCNHFDMLHALEPGTGLRVSKMLMFDRSLRAPMDALSLPDEPMSSIALQLVKARRTAGDR